MSRPMRRPSTWPCPRGRRRASRCGARGRSAARSHDTPVDASSTGCGWPPALEIPVGDWRSGYYSVTVTAGDERADAFLVVRPDPSEPAPILLVLSTTTWHAYNDWGGPSLYTGGTRVSFERPLREGLPGQAGADRPDDAARARPGGDGRSARGPARWACRTGAAGPAGSRTSGPSRAGPRRTGIGSTSRSRRTSSEHPEILEGPRLYLSVGHDEYWSWGMRDAVDAFVGRGGNAAILSGNTSFWQVRFDPAIVG